MTIVENFDLFAPRLINKKELISSAPPRLFRLRRSAGRAANVQSSWRKYCHRLRDRLHGNHFQYVSLHRLESALDSRGF